LQKTNYTQNSLQLKIEYFWCSKFCKIFICSNGCGLIRNFNLHVQKCVNFIVAPQNAGDEFAPLGAAKMVGRCIAYQNGILSNQTALQVHAQNQGQKYFAINQTKIKILVGHLVL
jgi:hypothetical protein